MILPNYETRLTEWIMLRLFQPFFVLSGEARGRNTLCLCFSCGKTTVRNFSTQRSESDAITSPSASENAGDLVSCFGRNIIRIIYSAALQAYVSLRCGSPDSKVEDGKRLTSQEGKWQGVPAGCSQQDGNNQRWDTERAPAHCWRTAAIRWVLASQAVKIYSRVRLLFPTLIKSINVFHFSRNCEVIHQLIMY